jgi:uncharacterized Zn finger protein
MARKRAAPAPSYWRERWLSYIWAEVFAFEEGDRPAIRRRSGIQLAFTKGRITAEIPVGRYGQHATVTFKVKPLGKRDWKRALDEISGSPEILQALLAGQPGEELEGLLDSLDIELFPLVDRYDDLRCHCDHSWSCNHPANLIYEVGEQLARNPFLWLTVMGLERSELLAAISARQADAMGAPDGPGLAANRFWSTPVDPDQIPVRPGEAVAPDALLRRLGPLSIPEAASVVTLVEKRPVQFEWGTYMVDNLVQVQVEEALTRYARLIGEGAAELAQGERLMLTAPSKLHGKAVPSKQRILPEILAAVQEAGQPLSIPELRLHSPTAQTLGVIQAEQRIMEAAADLPAPFGLVGRFYVADQTTLLEGARFRHTVSFTEWYERCISLDSDWVRALLTAGLQPPFQVTVAERRYWISLEQPSADLFATLAPNVGDEWELTLLDPALPLLRLDRRSQQTGAVPQAAADLKALAALREGVLLNGELTEAEGVGLLLAAGTYAADPPPNPVWLLPLVSGEAGPALNGPDRRLIPPSWQAWKPSLGREAFGYWINQNQRELEFEAKLRATGVWNRDQLHDARRWLGHWLRMNPGTHENPAGAPSLTSFLHYLWIDLPQQAVESHWPTQRVPELFAAWFTLLAGDQQGLADHYRPHLAACALTERFQRRAVPDDKEEHISWYSEGMRWIGPKLLFKG